MPGSHLLLGLTQPTISFDSLLFVHGLCAIFHFRNTITFLLEQKKCFFHNNKTHFQFCLHDDAIMPSYSSFYVENIVEILFGYWK